MYFIQGLIHIKKEGREEKAVRERRVVEIYIVKKEVFYNIVILGH